MLSMVLCAAAAAALVWVLRVRRALAASMAREQALARLVRLAAADLRAPVLGLLGHAEAVSPALRTSLVGVCRGLLELAEALQEATEEPGARRHLREEAVRLGTLLPAVVAQVAAGLGPGQRAWRIAPAVLQAMLLADRRALHQVLLRVLSSAALATGAGDWIDISAEAADGSWTLVVMDEGLGLAVAPAEGAGAQTRGLGVGLSLARSLMQAHGGTLALESAASIGTRAMLRFPASRVLQQA